MKPAGKIGNYLKNSKVNYFSLIQKSQKFSKKVILRNSAFLSLFFNLFWIFDILKMLNSRVLLNF